MKIKFLVLFSQVLSIFLIASCSHTTRAEGNVTSYKADMEIAIETMLRNLDFIREDIKSVTEDARESFFLSGVYESSEDEIILYKSLEFDVDSLIRELDVYSDENFGEPKNLIGQLHKCYEQVLNAEFAINLHYQDMLSRTKQEDKNFTDLYKLHVLTHYQIALARLSYKSISIMERSFLEFRRVQLRVKLDKQLIRDFVAIWQIMYMQTGHVLSRLYDISVTTLGEGESMKSQDPILEVSKRVSSALQSLVVEFNRMMQFTKGKYNNSLDSRS